MEFNFQNMVDMWAKNQMKVLGKKARIAYKKSNRLKNKIVQRDWKNDWSTLNDFYYANKAIFHGASRNLPFKTLTYLGQLLAHDYFKSEVQSIIKENVIKFDGQFYKLDDPESQGKIQKALRSYKFQKVDQVAA